MDEDDREWMAYIDGEVRAACEATRCGHQIRRKWSVRDRPAAASPIDDYEWKLIRTGTPSNDFEGAYYVLQFDRSSRNFVFEHDTVRAGLGGPPWERTTSTTIHPQDGRYPSGWLRDHLVQLVTQFGPNHFSAT